MSHKYLDELTDDELKILFLEVVDECLGLTVF